MEDKLLSAQDLADRYDMTLAAVYGWNYNRKGPRYIKIGSGAGRIFYRLADVLAWEKSQLVDNRRGR